jgi:hypothetical protein
MAYTQTFFRGPIFVLSSPLFYFFVPRCFVLIPLSFAFLHHAGSWHGVSGRIQVFMFSFSSAEFLLKSV